MADSKAAKERRQSKDRRNEDRREQQAEVAEDRRQEEGRRKVQRRRQIDPTTCERDYSLDEIEFMQALDNYKRDSGRMFPTCSEILEVLRSIGYVCLNDEQREILGLELSQLPVGPQPEAANNDEEEDLQEDG